MAKQPQFRFDLGEHVRDVVTKLEGVIITRYEQMTGCLQYAVQPQGLDENGKIKDSYYIDESRCEALKKKPVGLVDAKALPGGPATSKPRSTRGR